jgi:hypothetical protein
MSDNQPSNRGYDVGPADEYKTLREELLVAKKYIFERPLLILALVAAGSRILETGYAVLLLVLAAALVLFNFWFTFNRLSSAARIAAYVQLELEARAHGRWVGWETCLREYRRWLKGDTGKKDVEIESSLDEEAVPDASMYYPPIYMLHIGLMFLVTAAAVVLTFRQWSWLSGVSAFLVMSLAVWFCAYLHPYRPKRMRTLIERNRVIWERVFEEMQRHALKQPGTELGVWLSAPPDC